MDSLDARALFIPRVSAYIIKAFSNWLEKVVRRRASKARTAYRMSQGRNKTRKACSSDTNF